MLWRGRLNKAERKAEREAEGERERRRNRFRILVCVDGSEASYEGIRIAAEIGGSDECDIILLYVRHVDQGLRSGGLEIRVARENMLEWGLELPGIQYLKTGLDMLIAEGHMAEEWDAVSSHTNALGDPLGDNKVEYRSQTGKSVVLKLKTAPDPAAGILDQYELGPYNVMILGAPGRWQGEFRWRWEAGVAKKVAMLSPCSVLMARPSRDGKGYLVCLDGSDRSLDAARRAAVLAQHADKTVTLMEVTPGGAQRKATEADLADAEAALGKMGIEVAETICRTGNFVQQVVKEGRDYALTAISDTGKSRLKRFLTGSATYDVMGKSRGSVLIIR